MSKNPTLIIVLQGGLVQDVVSDNPAFFDKVNITVIDYDTDNAEADDTVEVEQEDGSYGEAFVSERSVSQATIPIPLRFNEEEEDEDES